MLKVIKGLAKKLTSTKFHKELPCRIFNREGFVAFDGREFEVGFGAHSVLVGLYKENDGVFLTWQ